MDPLSHGAAIGTFFHQLCSSNFIQRIMKGSSNFIKCNKKDPRKFRRRWLKILERVILNLSDQQLISGLAVLVAGLSLHCTISVYHFSLVKDLGWISATVHLLTVATLRRFFIRNRSFRNIRFVMIFINAALLLACQTISIHARWQASFPYPAQCLIDNFDSISGGRLAWMIILMVYHILLLGGFFDLRLGLYLLVVKSRSWTGRPDIAEISAIDVDHPKHDSFAMLEDPSTVRISFLQRAERRLVATTDFGLKRLYCSRAFGWSICSVSFGFGCSVMIEDLHRAGRNTRREEMRMGFGQIIPVFLLCSTLLVLLHALSGEKVGQYHLV